MGFNNQAVATCAKEAQTQKATAPNREKTIMACKKRLDNMSLKSGGYISMKLYGVNTNNVCFLNICM